ncbi:hypothetical protein SASPL_143271 [Salvia splendens]|uniref:Uncharacterized protein n=1 Tax=Salvia splendens TaxID=180675 RepID=A0A8X8Z9K9_SALSN|nr:hypothetical protein SASPL_143271 [Salvia splendens]
MGKEIEELRPEKLSATKAIEELTVKEVEAYRVAQELKRKNAEALQTIEELRVKKMKSDKAVGFYENDLDPRISKLERTLANLFSVDVEDLDGAPVPPSHAAGNIVIVIDDSDSGSDNETSVPDSSSGKRNKEDRTDSSEDSLLSTTKRRKLSSSATPSRSSLPSRVEERVDALQQPRTLDCVDSTDSDDDLISDEHMNNLVATCQSKVRSTKG